MTTVGTRTSDHPINPIFLERWSPRAFSGEAMPKEDLMTILEAARWAPSSYNSQPWRFVYAMRDTPAWEPMLGLLVEFNRGWAKDASALVVLASASLMAVPGKDAPVPSHSHSMDSGAGWAYAALQAQMMGYRTHGMVGFDLDGAFASLGFREGYRVEQMFAVGKQGDKSKLPEAMQQREMPSPRKPLAETVFEGKFGG